MIKNNKLFGETILLLSALIWGVGYPVVAIALNSGAGELFLTMTRFTLAVLIQLPFIYKKLQYLNKELILKGLILGVLLGLGFFTQTIGQKSTTTTNVAFLTSVNIVLIPFSSYFIIKKKIQMRSIIAAFITLVGIAFLTLGSTFQINLGDFYILLCALFFALYASATDKYAKEEDPTILVFLQFVTIAILATTAFFLSEEKAVLNPASIGSIIYLGIFSNLIASLFYTFGLKHTSAERASIILSLESVFGSILGIILFSEPYNYKLFFGSALILFAIMYSENIILKNKKISI